MVRKTLLAVLVAIGVIFYAGALDEGVSPQNAKVAASEVYVEGRTPTNATQLEQTTGKVPKRFHRPCF